MNAAIRHVADVSRFHARQRPDAPALLFGKEHTSWAELDRRASRVARGLAIEGVARGEAVAYLGRNTDAFFELFFGAAKAGAVLVPVNWRLAPAEIAYVLRDSEARLLFVEQGFFPQIAQIRDELRSVARFVAIGGELPDGDPYPVWRERQDEADPRLEVPAEEAFVRLYTSGTTGQPKGVQISSRALLLAHEFQERSGEDCFRVEPSDVGLAYLPLFHIGGTKVAFDHFYRGAALLVLSQFETGPVLEAIAGNPVRRLFLAPTMIQMLLDDPRSRTTDFSRLEYVTYGGAPISADLLQRARAALGCGFVQTYALTETTGMGAFLPPSEHVDGSPRMRAAGRPHPGFELRIVDEEGRALGPGQIGEICLRARCLMLGYWKRPEATAEALREGWLHTGDAGCTDEDGFVYIQDRVKDMIVSGAENIYPAEVENAIAHHPAVHAVAVVGVPDPKWGEAVKAIVVPVPGARVDAQEIIDFTRRRIAGYKLPRSVDFVDELPVGPTGKVLRRELREPYWAGRDRRVG